ncbi:MAG: Unknown protein [uncultured Campylobacterales bacterium]|uniref:Inner membrane protein YgaP-like transmembrane domain-containing protein n=1 Tax=uncultured Campylobacterales bacterium TaxID=352960 RepID=A0A6S6SUH9_9BACT|nr:MAG: Unknown protein [uncultured Campylobacterales bacterium]
MKCNVGKVDKFIRICLGIICISFGIYSESWWGGVIGLLPIYTISIAWCPKSLFCAVPSEKWWHKCCRG